MAKRRTNPYIKPLLNRWKKRLDLSNWEFELVETSHINSKGSIAQVSVWTEQRFARIHYLRGLSFAHTRSVVIHELLHVVHFPVSDFSTDALEDNKLATKAWKQREEEYITHLERCLEQMYPDRDLR